MHVLDFSTELQNSEVSVTLLKSDSSTDALSAILKFFRTKETIAAESVFGIIIGGCIKQLAFFKRNATKDVFFDNFPKLL